MLRSFFNADAIITSSISLSGKSVRSTFDRDVMSLQIDVAISTSMIQSIVIWGSAVLKRASVLKLTFQLWNSTHSGNSLKFYGNSRINHHTIVRITSTSKIQGFRVRCDDVSSGDVSSFFLGIKWLCVKASSLFLPYTDQVEDALQSNSFVISHDIIFLKPPGSLSYSCRHEGPYIPISSSMSFSSAHIIPNSTSRSLIMWNSVAPHRRPSRSTLKTLEMQSSNISKLLLESGAYTAITTVVPTGIAVHRSSKFHDLLIVQNWSDTNNVANPDLPPWHTYPVSSMRTWSPEWLGWWKSVCEREQVPRVFLSWWKCLKTVGDWHVLKSAVRIESENATLPSTWFDNCLEKCFTKFCTTSGLIFQATQDLLFQEVYFAAIELPTKKLIWIFLLFLGLIASSFSEILSGSFPILPRPPAHATCRVLFWSLL